MCLVPYSFGIQGSLYFGILGALPHLYYSLTPIEACHFWYLGFSCILVFWELYPMCTIHWINKLYPNPATA